jgi:CRP/FNR family transcriptional regulator, cyclic AMP receptor protein
VLRVRIAAFSNQGDGTDGSVESQSFLKDASASDWAKLFACTRDLCFDPGDTLVHAGDVNRSMYIVLSGQLEILIGQEEEKGQVVAKIDAGAIFGEQSFLDGLPRSGTVRAITPGDVRVLDWVAFEQLSDREPKLGQLILRDIARTLSIRLRQTNRLLV